MNRLYEKIAIRHFREVRKMLFLMGPRQVGKTTTSREVGRGRDRSVYLNWDNLDHQKIVLEGPSRLAGEVGADILQDQLPLLILDEIHKYPLWRTLVKGLYDTYSESMDILVTGSARLSAFHSSGDSMMGRYFSYRMHPLSAAEIIRPEAGEAPGERPPQPIADQPWAAFLRHGGFPEPLTRQDDRFTARWRRLRHQQLFREELRDLTRVQEVSKVEMLAQLIWQRAGQLTSYATLANGVDASIDSVKRWLSILESLYYCFSLRPWYRNVARSLRKKPKYYLWDWSLLDEPGVRYENLLASALLKAAHLWTDHGFGDFGLYFVRDKQKQEVDFLLSRDGEPWILVEAKRSSKAGLSRSLLHHHDQLKTPLALQVALDLPFTDKDCFKVLRPAIVPAKTFLSQLV